MAVAVAVAPAWDGAGFMGRALGTAIARAVPVLATGRDGSAEPGPTARGGTTAQASHDAALAAPGEPCPVRTGAPCTGMSPWRPFARPVHDVPPVPPAGPDRVVIPCATIAAAGVAPIPTVGPPTKPAITPPGPA